MSPVQLKRGRSDSGQSSRSGSKEPPSPKHPKVEARSLPDSILTDNMRQIVDPALPEEMAAKTPQVSDLERRVGDDLLQWKRRREGLLAELAQGDRQAKDLKLKIAHMEQDRLQSWILECKRVATLFLGWRNQMITAERQTERKGRGRLGNFHPEINDYFDVTTKFFRQDCSCVAMQNRGLVFLYDAPLATQTPIVGPGMQIVSSSLKLTDQATRKANGGGAAVNHAAGCTSLGGATTTTLVPNKSMTSTGKVDAEKAQLLMLSEESLDLLQRAGAPAPPPGRAPALNFTSGLSERLARRLTVERSNPTRTVTYVGAGTQERFYVEVASNHVVKPASTSTKSTSCTSGAGTGGGGKNGDNNANAKNYNPTSSKVVNLSANNKASSSTVVTSNGNANNKNGGKSSGGGVRIQPAGANNRMSNNYPVRIQPKAEQPGVHLAAPKKSKSSDSPNDDDDNQQHKQNEEVSFFFHGPDALRKVLEKRRAEHNLQRAKMMAGAHHSMMKSSASVQLVAAPHSTSATLTSRATAAGQQHARSKDREEGQLPSSERLAATAAECAACLQSCQKQFLKERKAGAGDPPHKLQQGKKKSNPSWSSANRRLVNSIAFGSDWETFLVVFPDGSWELGGSGIPKTLTEKLWDTSPQDSRRPRSDLVCVHLGPRGEWYLEMQDGERWWGGIPDDFAQQLQPDRVRRIYFGSQGTYAVRSCDAKDLASDMNGAIAGDHTTRDVDMM